MRYLILLLITTVLFANNLKRDGSLGVVTDSENKLVWIDNKDTIRLELSHKDAVPYCEDLEYAGYASWRLPDIEEFETIVDKKNLKTSINRAFKYNVPFGYWAYKAHMRTFWFYADYMNFVSGTAYYDNRNKNKLVRCVRDLD